MKELTLFDGKGMKVNEDGMVSLTDLWRANGRGNDKPSHWMRHVDVTDFIAEVVEKVVGHHLYTKPAALGKLGSMKSIRDRAESVADAATGFGLLKTTKGRIGGTFAHWQIALAYAQFLSPELHMAVNAVFKGFAEADASIATSVLERTKDQKAVEKIALKAIDKTEDPEALRRQEMRARSKFANKGINAEIAARGGDQVTHARVANMNNLSITGMKAKEFREAHNLPAKASTREHLTLEQMAIMTFQELAESSALRNKNVFGKSAIVAAVGETINDVQMLVRRVGMVPA